MKRVSEKLCYKLCLVPFILLTLTPLYLQTGEHSSYTCPNCGTALIQDNNREWRCNNTRCNSEVRRPISPPPPTLNRVMSPSSFSSSGAGPGDCLIAQPVIQNEADMYALFDELMNETPQETRGLPVPHPPALQQPISRTNSLHSESLSLSHSHIHSHSHTHSNQPSLEESEALLEVLLWNKVPVHLQQPAVEQTQSSIPVNLIPILQSLQHTLSTLHEPGHLLSFVVEDMLASHGFGKSSLNCLFSSLNTFNSLTHTFVVIDGESGSVYAVVTNGEQVIIHDPAANGSVSVFSLNNMDHKTELFQTLSAFNEANSSNIRIFRFTSFLQR